MPNGIATLGARFPIPPPDPKAYTQSNWYVLLWMNETWARLFGVSTPSKLWLSSQFPSLNPQWSKRSKFKTTKTTKHQVNKNTDPKSMSHWAKWFGYPTLYCSPFKDSPFGQATFSIPRSNLSRADPLNGTGSNGQQGSRSLCLGILRRIVRSQTFQWRS